jgi:hypothetical protein
MKKLGMVVVMLVVPGLALAQPKAPAGAGSAAPAKAPPAAGAGSAAAPKAPAGGAPAGGAPATGAAMKPPPPPPEVKMTVDTFKGNWKFDTTMTATGMPGMDKPFTGKMTFNCKEVAGKTAVSCDAKMKTPLGPLDALFAVAYDPWSKSVNFIGISNMNEVHTHLCKWSGADLNCAPLKGGMGPAGDEITEDIKMTFAPNPTCKPKDAANPLASCPYKTVSFTSVSKMTKGGATMTFEGKGKK